MTGQTIATHPHLQGATLPEQVCSPGLRPFAVRPALAVGSDQRNNSFLSTSTTCAPFLLPGFQPFHFEKTGLKRLDGNSQRTAASARMAQQPERSPAPAVDSRLPSGAVQKRTSPPPRHGTAMESGNLLSPYIQDWRKFSCKNFSFFPEIFSPALCPTTDGRSNPPGGGGIDPPAGYRIRSYSPTPPGPPSGLPPGQKPPARCR